VRFCCKSSSTCIVLILVLLASVFSITGGHAAQEKSRITEPIPIASEADVPSVATPVNRLNRPEGVAGESRVDAVRKRFQSILEQLGRTVETSTQKIQLIPKNTTDANASLQADGVAGKSITATGVDLDVRYRPFAGTPRQIKMKANATTDRSAGKLCSALEGMAPGKNRDKSTARDFLREQSGLLKISDTDKELALKRYWTDDLGRTHLRYTQNYKGIPVWPAELNVHLDADGDVDLVNGAYVATPRRLVHIPVVTQNKAEVIATDHIQSTELPEAVDSELIVYAPGSNANRLSWKVRLLVSQSADWIVVVDAANGNVLTAYNQVKTDGESGSGTDLTNTTRDLNVWFEDNLYYMIDTSKSMFDVSSDPPASGQTDGAIFVFDMANNALSDDGTLSAQHITSTSSNSGWLQDGVSLAYNLSQTYDYFQTVHNRDSVDGNGGNILGFVRVGTDFDNAFWTSEYNAVFFGDARSYAAALDVVAHEITHGITQYTCNLVYKDQPGALNEAFSDIFGEMVEARTNGSTDWINGTVFNDDSSRNLKDPSSVEIVQGYDYTYPSKMSEYYSRGSELLQMLQDEDYGGVHINMTIVSHAFYLLAEGLTDAIGQDKAADIFYRAQTVHLVTNSQFIDMRLACIQSAEELYGTDSVEVQKVAEAFDAVEITDSSATPTDPDSSEPVSGEDSYIFLSLNSEDGYYYLARRETAQDDNEYGTFLSSRPARRARPSVSGDGDTAFFVDTANDACFIDTDTDGSESCLGMSGQIYSGAMSPDEQVYGFVMVDEDTIDDEYGPMPLNQITVVDLRDGGTDKVFDLTAPGTEGYSVQTVVYADTMDFTSDNRYLIYDAYNVLELEDGSQTGVWSIYAIDLETEQTIALISPTPGYDIGYPSISQSTDHMLTWDQFDSSSGISTLAAGNLITGDTVAVGTVNGDYGVPGYNGDDSAIAYGQVDSTYDTGYSMDIQPLAEDMMTPDGSPTRDLVDAEFGVIYRRGTYTASVADISISPASLDFGDTALNETTTQTITIENSGSANLMIENLALAGLNHTVFAFRSSCIGQQLAAGGSCSVNVDFTPTILDVKTAMLTVTSDDPDTPSVTVSLSGTGISEDTSGTTTDPADSGSGGGGGGCMINTISAGTGDCLAEIAILLLCCLGISIARYDM